MTLKFMNLDILQLLNRQMKKLILVFFISFNFYAQDHNTLFFTHFMENRNPGFIGLSEFNHISFETVQSFDLNKKTSNSSLLHGSSFFQDYNFFLGYKIKSNYFSDIGIGNTELSISYTYRLKINQKYMMYPFIALNYKIPSKFSDLYFEDQILFGGSSNDPVLDYYKAKGYVDFNSGMVLKNKNFLFALTVNNISKANTSTNNEQAVRIGRTMDLSLGAQIEFKNFGLFLLGTYFSKPSIRKNENFSEFRLDQEIIFYNFNINLFQEFFSNTFSFGFKNVGMSISFPIENYEFGIGYKSSLSNSIKNNDNFIGVMFRYRFDFLNFSSFLKWEEDTYY